MAMYLIVRKKLLSKRFFAQWKTFMQPQKLPAKIQRSKGESRASLEDASLYPPGQNPLIVGSWRGRLDAVEGWAMGVYFQANF
ncbi:hypothetical protein B0H03_1239 [Rathayibacter iranicus NCPPB 2253 = VKM Ac-1602]|nr:hypothetical protein C5E01_04245 [Rathayibacter iranicus]PWJ60876.1 hypothetical protein B0H03_1239 [Rathayibacter iranicus NCPPB 2253 = VKM Ac-1602]